MKFGSFFLLIVAGLLLFIAACERPPELSSVPIISFESIEYKQVSDKADSLILTIGFEDNEGDLGVSRIEEPPIILFPKDENGNPILFGSSDTLPPYNVCDYAIIPNKDNNTNDTVYIQIDMNSYNMYLTFYRKVRGEMQEFDFRREFGPQNCFTMDGRFLRLNTQPQDRPLQGSLRYGMSSHVFGTVFRLTDTLQIRVRIRDNAFNISNYAETPEFTLAGIKAN